MMRFAGPSRGFTLIELVIVVIVLAVVAAVAVSKLGPQIETAKVEQTKREMEQLARAIVGNPAVYGSGTRGDFGYVGDVGALPPNLDALVQNPGGYATWDGPYIEAGMNGADFKTDGWGAPYVYQDTLIRSVGSGSNIDKVFAPSTAALVANTVEGAVRDAGMRPPGAAFRDSLQVLLSYPDGAGGEATAVQVPSTAGKFQFSSVPIGRHTLRVVYLPLADTTTYEVTVYPGRTARLDVVLPVTLW